MIRDESPPVGLTLTATQIQAVVDALTVALRYDPELRDPENTKAALFKLTEMLEFIPPHGKKQRMIKHLMSIGIECFTSTGAGSSVASLTTEHAERPRQTIKTAWEVQAGFDALGLRLSAPNEAWALATAEYPQPSSICPSQSSSSRFPQTSSAPGFTAGFESSQSVSG